MGLNRLEEEKKKKEKKVPALRAGKVPHLSTSNHIHHSHSRLIFIIHRRPPPPLLQTIKIDFPDHHVIVKLSFSPHGTGYTMCG